MGAWGWAFIGLAAVFVVGLIAASIDWNPKKTEALKNRRDELDRQDRERWAAEAAARKQRAIDGFVKPEAPTQTGKSVTFTCGSGCQIDYFDDGEHTGTTHSRLTPEEVQALIKKAFGEQK